MVLKVVFTLRVSGSYCTVNYCPGYSRSHVTTFSSLAYFLSTQYALSLIARMLTLSADSPQSYVSTCSHYMCQQLRHAPTYWLFALYLASALVPHLVFPNAPFGLRFYASFFRSCSFLFLNQSSQLLSVILFNFRFFLSELSSRNC